MRSTARTTRIHFVQGASLADDLTHDAFLRAHQAWARFRGDAPERIWLLRIARNVCLDYLCGPRSRARGTISLENGPDAAPGAELVGKEPPLSVEQVVRQAEMTDCVQQFVLSLPETLRTPLILHDAEGLTNAQIAQVLACSLDAAKMRLHRGTRPHRSPRSRRGWRSRGARRAYATVTLIAGQERRSSTTVIVSSGSTPMG